MQNENNKNETLKESKTSPWLDWAVKLQAIAQAGLTYGKDVYDRERYEQIRDIAAEMISLHSGISKEKVVDLFCSETGYQTPKLDTRAAVFQDGKILLVKENNGTWSLPGAGLMWMYLCMTILLKRSKKNLVLMSLSIL